MINILSIILLVFGVLQIILFFKLWGMTNNVSKILRKLSYPYHKELSSEPSEEEFMFLYLFYNKGKEAAKEQLVKMIWCTEDIKTMLTTENENLFNAARNGLKNRYERFYQMLGEEFPSFDDLRKYK